VHKNARLTPKGRALMLGRLEAGQHQLDVAQAMGVSLTTLKKWLRRYRHEGLAGLQDRSCRPRRSPGQLPAALSAQVIHLRQQRRTGRFICARLGVSAASVSRILCRVHLSRWRELDLNACLKARQQLKAMLLRHGHRYRGRRPWTAASDRTLSNIRFVHPAQIIAFAEYRQAVRDTHQRLERALKFPD